ncbi:TetR/AcrR family transcriptional regulator C-terminal ligand-binding domain-containing protein [Nocardia sp. NPDC049149]|uniref:TetR-like C-terminal domain-containing protein n=1 Tax=Nocardia sp. NPDC049149 TaxID=3364315 RepID=UPI003723656A
MDAESRAGTDDAQPRPARLRAGGRSERVRRAVAEAGLALLQEGRIDFSVAEVAERAGVHRTTVYRWWPTPAELVREAMTVHTARLVVPDTGSWDEDVLALCVQLAEFFADPVEIAINAVMASGSHPELNTIQVQHWDPISLEFATLIERAKRRGEVTADADPEIVLNLLTAPLLMHTVMLHSQPAPDLVRGIAAAVSRAFSTTPSSATTQPS